MENHMLDIMFHLPNLKGVSKCIITREVLLKRADPTYVDKKRKKAQ
jgi:ATP-dependent protease Clp ATPase subunit